MLKRILICLCLLTFITCKKEYSETTLLKDIPTGFLINLSDGLFTQTMPDSEFSRFYLKNHPKEYINYFNLSINVNKDGSITYRSTPTNPKDFIADIIDFTDFSAEGKTTLLHINFNKNCTLQDFITIKNLINKIDQPTLQINKNLFVYDPLKLPNCDCTL